MSEAGEVTVYHILLVVLGYVGATAGMMKGDPQFDPFWRVCVRALVGAFVVAGPVILLKALLL